MLPFTSQLFEEPYASLQPRRDPDVQRAGALERDAHDGVCVARLDFDSIGLVVEEKVDAVPR